MTFNEWKMHSISSLFSSTNSSGPYGTSASTTLTWCSTAMPSSHATWTIKRLTKSEQSWNWRKKISWGASNYCKYHVSTQMIRMFTKHIADMFWESLQRVEIYYNLTSSSKTLQIGPSSRLTTKSLRTHVLPRSVAWEMDNSAALWAESAILRNLAKHNPIRTLASNNIRICSTKEQLEFLAAQ